MNTKEYWIKESLKNIIIKSKKYTKEDIIKSLSKEYYNLKQDLNISASTAANLTKKLCPNRKNINTKIDNYLLSTLNKKYCHQCKLVKDIIEFNSNNSTYDKLSSSCSKCHCLIQQQYYKNNSKAQILRVQSRKRNILGKLNQADIEFIFTRDNYKCKYCNLSNENHNINWGTNLHLDHIIPVSKGGINSIDNLQLLCINCNIKKRDTDP